MARRRYRFLLGLSVLTVGRFRWSGEIKIVKGGSSLGVVSSTSVSTGSVSISDGYLYLSPYGSKDMVIEKLKSAKYTIRIWGYQISDPEVIKVLKNKAMLGVSVQVILENSTHGGETEDFFDFFKEMKGSGVEVRTDEGLGTNYVHAKTILIDETAYIISTANFSYAGFSLNREHRFVGYDTGTIQTLGAIFVADRTEQPYSKPLSSSLRVCPWNCRSELMRFIESAEKSIDIQAQYLEDPALITLLAQKAEAGVIIRIIVGKFQESGPIGAVQSLMKKQSDPNVHAKTMLIDGEKIYIGSMNLSTNAIEHNREIGIVASDPHVIKKFIEQFQKDREQNTAF